VHCVARTISRASVRSTYELLSFLEHHLHNAAAIYGTFFAALNRLLTRSFFTRPRRISMLRQVVLSYQRDGTFVPLLPGETVRYFVPVESRQAVAMRIYGERRLQFFIASLVTGS
jgi:hypothetical protein